MFLYDQKRNFENPVIFIRVFQAFVYDLLLQIT